MDLHKSAERLGQMEALDGVAEPAAKAVTRAVPPGLVKDALSGTWLGHPLHPMLTDIPIGMLTSATVLDVLGGRRGRRAADLFVALGLLSAVPTAAAGAADWSDTQGAARRIGVVHAGANLVGLACYAASLRARWHGRRLSGAALALGGMTAMTVGGYLGGHLSFTHGVGVNHGFTDETPEGWAAVTSDASLDDQPHLVDAAGAAVLVQRCGGAIRAVGGRCSHAGGPLEEGSVDTAACTVRCPWHGSVFGLEDGHVVHGPATVPQAAYDTRVVDDTVEVRRRR